MSKVRKSIGGAQGLAVPDEAHRFDLHGVSATDATPSGEVGSVFINHNKCSTDHRAEVKNNLKKRVKRLSVAKPLAHALMDAAKGPLMGNAYRRTALLCNSTLEQKAETGSLKTYFCGSRWCACCGAIRSAKAWHAYGPSVEAFTEPMLLTLTIPNVKGSRLRHAVRGMHHEIRNIARSVRRQLGEIKFIRTTEVTYSKVRDDMHPHLHLLVETKKVADAIRLGWLARYPDARSVGQDMRRADRQAMAEIWKYATKLITDTKDEDGSRSVVPPDKLDDIFTALRGLRLMSVVGIRSLTGKDVSNDEDELELDTSTPAIVRPQDDVAWEYSQTLMDFADYRTGELLTGFRPSKTHAAFVKKLEALTEGFS